MKQRIKELVKKNPLLIKLYTSYITGSTFKPKYEKKSVKGSGNKLAFDNSSLFVNCKIIINGNNNEIVVEDSTFLMQVTFYIFGNNNKVFISKGVEFSEGGSVWIEDDYCEVMIGEKTSFRNTSIAVTEPHSKVEIGKDCLFSYDVDVRTGDSHSIIDLETNKRINYAKNISIGDHVWVASHVSILKGVVIPKNTIIATRSLVTKKFDKENTLIGGSPAVIRKENITWKTERIYDQ